MTIEIGICTEEKNKIRKRWDIVATLTGYLRDESSIFNPSIIIESEYLSNVNYMYIPDFDRYYFIDDITSIRNGLWMISATVDVLTTYQDRILNLDCILSGSESEGANKYMLGDAFRRNVKAKTDIYNFPSGLLESGEFILITAGG